MTEEGRPEATPGHQDARAHASVYDLRFGERERSAKEAVWREIGRFLQRRYIPGSSKVLDIATDEGYFIRNIAAAERWASDLRDTSSSMPDGVRFIQSDGLSLSGSVPNEYFDVVFMSNYLEHLDSSDSVIEQFRVAHRLLRKGGRVIVLQPNIKLVGAAYWDFIDHHVALTETSLVEAATFAGFTTEDVIQRFLPYSVKGKLPAHPTLVRAYLAFRPAWWFLGKQTLYVGRGS
jgi:ubiquinone/menaquinone biosynthesis C-methylase UbiE